MDGGNPSEAVADVVLKATNRRHSMVPPDLANSIKRLCKQSEKNIDLAFELVFQRLKQPNSQVRLLALELCYELFNRSRRFRSHLSAKFTLFLELVTGFKPDNPLPQPFSAATALRERAAAILERWNLDFGSKYKQVALGYDYLKNKLQLAAPRLSDSANGEPQREVSAEVSEAFRRYQIICEEQPALLQEYISVVAQMEECLGVLRERERLQYGVQPGHGRAAGLEQDDMDWEDIAGGSVKEDDQHVAETAFVHRSRTGAGSSSSNSVERRFWQTADASSCMATAQITTTSPTPPPHDDAVMEALTGLYKVLKSRAIPTASRWLTILSEVRLAPDDTRLQTQRQQLENQTTDLLSRLIDYRHQYEQIAAQVHPPPKAQHGQADSGEAAVSLDDLFHEGLAEEQIVGGGHRGSVLGNEADKAVQQQQQQSSCAAHTARTSVQPQSMPNTRSRQNRQQPSNKAVHSQQADNSVVSKITEPSGMQNPYETLRDPTAPRKRPAEKHCFSSSSAAAAPPAPAELPKFQQAGSNLPESVRRKLAEKAPVLPNGLYTQYWDTNAAPVYVSGHGLEVSNHWGPVDVHTELPPERVEELFMHAYTIPSGDRSGGRQQQQQQGGNQRGWGSSMEAQHAAAHPVDSRRAGTKVGQRGRSSTAADGDHQRSGGGILGVFTEEEGRVVKRARRATERAYNEAVLGGAMADEQLAKQLHEAELARMAVTPGGAEAKQRASKPKLTVRERLQKKLMKGKAAAERDLSTLEAERYRDSVSNRWENK